MRGCIAVLGLDSWLIILELGSGWTRRPEGAPAETGVQYGAKLHTGTFFASVRVSLLSAKYGTYFEGFIFGADRGQLLRLARR